MIKTTTREIASSSDVNAPVFYFEKYVRGRVYHNNGRRIDFVTDGDSLYVPTTDNVTAIKDAIEEDGGFMRLVSKGKQGIQGIKGDPGHDGRTPSVFARFDGRQMIFFTNDVEEDGTPKVDADGNPVIKRIGATNDLTGPSWRPKLIDNTIIWEKTRDDSQPESIDLTEFVQKTAPVILRVNSDNTKRSDETSGPANYIQWKYEGDEYWNNLISISELMNLTLAGVAIWKNEDGEIHFGHREVIKAEYTATHTGKQIITDVELGDILFDAGKIPFPDYTLDIELMKQKLCDMEDELANIPTRVSQLINDVPYATAEDLLHYQPKGNYLTEHQPIKSINGTPVAGYGNFELLTPGDLDLYAKKTEIPDAYTKAESNSRFQPAGNYLTEHQHLKTINGQSLVGTGNITIEGGSSVDLSDYVKSVNGNRPDANGNVSISVAGNPIMELKIESNSLYKKSANDSSWQLVGSVSGGSGSGSGDGISEARVLELINDAIADLNICEQCWDESRIQVIENNISNLFEAIREGTIEINSSYFVFATIYQRTDDLTAPTTQTSFNGQSITLDDYGDVSESALATKLGSNNAWKTHPSDTGLYLWESHARVKIENESGLFVSDWSTPVRLTGVNGKDGEDGSDMEFVYFRTKSSLAPTIGNTGHYYDESTSSWKTSTDLTHIDDILPNVGNITNVGDDTEAPSAERGYWKDHPYGISQEYTHEWVGIRKKKSNGVWSNFTVTLWSRWGEDGLDGDGVEYIFRLATKDQVNDNDGVITLKSGQALPNNNWEYDSPVAPWTDDPSDVTPTNPYSFVSLRRFTNNAWSNWSEPALWAKYGFDGNDAVGYSLDIYNDNINVRLNSEKKTSAEIVHARFKVVRSDGELIGADGLSDFKVDGVAVTLGQEKNINGKKVTVTFDNDTKYGKIVATYENAWTADKAPMLTELSLNALGTPLSGTLFTTPVDSEHVYEAVGYGNYLVKDADKTYFTNKDAKLVFKVMIKDALTGTFEEISTAQRDLMRFQLELDGVNAFTGRTFTQLNNLTGITAELHNAAADRPNYVEITIGLKSETNPSYYDFNEKAVFTVQYNDNGDDTVIFHDSEWVDGVVFNGADGTSGGEIEGTSLTFGNVSETIHYINNRAIDKCDGRTIITQGLSLAKNSDLRGKTLKVFLGNTEKASYSFDACIATFHEEPATVWFKNGTSRESLGFSFSNSPILLGMKGIGTTINGINHWMVQVYVNLRNDGNEKIITDNDSINNIEYRIVDSNNNTVVSNTSYAENTSAVEIDASSAIATIAGNEFPTKTGTGYPRKYIGDFGIVNDEIKGATALGIYNSVQQLQPLGQIGFSVTQLLQLMYRGLVDGTGNSLSLCPIALNQDGKIYALNNNGYWEDTGLVASNYPSYHGSPIMPKNQ